MTLLHMGTKSAARDEDRDLYELTNSDTMPEVLRAIRRTRPAVLVRAADNRDRDAEIVDVHEDGRWIQLAIDDSPPAGPCIVHLTLHEVVFLLHGSLSRAETYELSGPLRLYSLDRRAASRLQLPEGRGELIWYPADDDDPRVGRSTIRDLSPNGAGITLDSDGLPLPDGMFAAAVKLGEVVVPCLAQTQRTSLDATGVHGVSLRAAGLSGSLIDAYLRERLPQLSPRCEAESAELESLMRDSGYLRLRDCGAEVETWRSLKPDDILSYDRVYRARDGRLLGHASATRIHSRTWLLHQLACRGGHAESGEARLALYMMMSSVPVLHDGDQATILAYFDQSNRWHQLFFKQFVEWIGDPATATICSLARFERSAPPEAFLLPPSTIDVGQPRDAERVEACALIRAQLPAVTANALDIHPAEIHRPSAHLGARGRSVLLLRENGEVKGAALCETGDRNLSLFNIVNIAQLFIRSGARGPSMPAQRALIAGVRAFYGDRGVLNPILVSPAGTLDGTAEPGTTWAESMGCVAFTGRSVRQWENFCRFHFGHRWRRHQTKRGRQ